jgi:hypothetical protein
MRKGVLTEAAVVGATFAALGVAIKYGYRKVGWDEENPAPRKEVPLPLFLFAAAAAGHLLWEATGGNHWFAKNYPATLPASQRDKFLVEQGDAISALARRG